MKNLLMIIMTVFLMPTAFADNVDVDHDLRPIHVREEFSVKSGDTKIIALPRYAYIDRVTFEVKTGLLCRKDNFRVAFDGYSAQSVSVAGGLKGYRNKILTVDVRTRTLEIYNTTDCKIKIRKIEALPRRWAQGRGGNHHPGPIYVPVSDAGAQLSFLLETLLYVENVLGDADRIQYLTPAKKTLGRALAVLNSAPETSQSSLKAIRDVLAQLSALRPLVDRLATIESTYEAAQEIQSVEAALERMVR